MALTYMELNYTTSLGRCTECDFTTEYNFNKHGAMSPCVECNASPVDIIRGA